MIKLLKIKRASQYYSYGGDVIDEMPIFEIEYNFKKVILTFWCDDNCNNLYINCFYIESERALSNYNMVTIVKKLKYTIYKQLIIDFDRKIAIKLIKQFKKKHLRR
jgi:hypothetical protein